MAFKKTAPLTPVPDNLEQLFRSLPRRRIPDVMPHQKEIMSAYVSQAKDKPDVALQLPTGSGKTLVGLLIAEWRRRKYRERVVYLCPTRQLVNQTVEQAADKYGLTVLAFTGSARDYTPHAKAQYSSAAAVAVTTYSSVFNVSPFFGDANALIVDDVHAAETYIADLWSLRVMAHDPHHSTLHTAMLGAIKPYLEPHDAARLSREPRSITDLAWVDKLPTPDVSAISDSVGALLDEHAEDARLAYQWSMIRDNFHACHLYLSSREILIRPLLPPTWTHAPFTEPRQRVYMSATLGEGGDLERLLGRRSIYRLPIPVGWDRQGVGRRFFLFPGMSLNTESELVLRHTLMRRAGRSLVLVPSDKKCAAVSKDVQDELGFAVFGADAIETSKAPFVSTSNAVAVVASRYDGIDFPGEDCRLLFIEGLPKATNLQEHFLMTRMSATILFNERVQVRVLQAVGRCTRSLEDYSAVVISGEELTRYLTDSERRQFLHPELQAEISFSLDQSMEVTLQDFEENFDIFLRNERAWEEENQQILSAREGIVQREFPAIAELSAVVAHEIDFQKHLWQGDYEAALASAEEVLGGLRASQLRGYRALWHYLAGSVAQKDSGGTGPKAQVHFANAKKAAPGVRWLVRLARHQRADAVVPEDNATVMEQIERVEAVLEYLGPVYHKKYIGREKAILDGLHSENTGLFEEAHMRLGELLGFEVGNIEADASPDPWWIAGQTCLVFEDHSGAQATSVLDATKARQVATHPAWVKHNVEGASGAEVLPVLVTPVRKATSGAMPHLQGVALWSLPDFQDWAENAMQVMRGLANSFSEAGDLVWRADAIGQLEQNGLDAPGLYGRLRGNVASKGLQVTG